MRNRTPGSEHGSAHCHSKAALHSLLCALKSEPLSSRAPGPPSLSSGVTVWVRTPLPFVPATSGLPRDRRGAERDRGTSRPPGRRRVRLRVSSIGRRAWAVRACPCDRSARHSHRPGAPRAARTTRGTARRPRTYQLGSRLRRRNTIFFWAVRVSGGAFSRADLAPT